MRAFLLALLTVGLACSVQAAAPPGRVFYAPFDGSLDAAEAVGSQTGAAEGKPEFMPGRLGQAVVVGDLGGSAAVAFDSVSLNLERGTLSLWVQPLNWQGDDKLIHLFFQAKTEGTGQYLLYKYSSAAWGAAFLIDPNEGRRANMYCYKPIPDWRPGQWHHLACAWTRHEAMKLYLDGKLVASSRGAGLSRSPLQGLMRFGGAWGNKGDRTALDEAMIFNRMLSDDEIASLTLEGPTMGRPAVPTEPTDLPGVMLTHAVLGQAVLARVYDDALGAPCPQAQLALVDETGRQIACQNLPLKPGLNEARLDLTGVPRGLYQARLTLLRDGQPAAVEALRVSKETDDTWATAVELGKRDGVLPPFTPLQASGNRLDCYARTATLGGDGLPTQITSRGASLLSAPVRLIATDGLGEMTWTPQSLQQRSSSASRATLHGAATSRALTLRTEVEARYDGTMWYRLTFEPKQMLDLRQLRLEISCTAALAKLYAFSAYGRIDEKRFGYGPVPDGQGTVWQREFLPSIWLGNEDLGLGWYADSDEHWDIDGEEALSLICDGQALRLCMNIIRQPRRIANPFTISFGLQATPVRPLQPDWRALQQIPSSEITRFFLHLRQSPYPRADVAGKVPTGRVAYLYAYHEYFTNTLPKDPDEFREMVRRVKDYGLLGTPYTDTTYMPESHGDLLLRPELLVDPPSRASSYGPFGSIDACHAGPFGDWYVWYIHHLISEYGLNGIYFDDMSPYGCANATHGCGYVGPDGQRRPTYAMRARTETFRRVRELFADTGRPFFITYHLSAGRVSPLATYGDGLLMAEERNPLVGKNPDYTENTTSAEWRASFSPEAWGIPVYVIPQFKMNAAWMKDPELAERLLAAVVPHDLLIWPLFAHEATLLGARKIQESFGIGESDVRCLPFWHADTGLRCDNAQVWLTGYLRPGKLLLCASNPTADPLPVQITLDLPQLRLPAAARATDLRAQSPLPLAGGKLSMTLPAKRVQFIEVK
jgi:hypothetical protein